MTGEYDAITTALQDLTTEVSRSSRLIEGEDGRAGPHINRGIVGAIGDLCDADADLEKRVGDLEAKWDRLVWTLAGAALGGGLAGGGLATFIIRAIGG